MTSSLVLTNIKLGKKEKNSEKNTQNSGDNRWENGK